MRRVIAAWIIAPLLAACGDDAALDALSSGGRETVAAVTSGDSLTLANGTRVRLAGVEAPNRGDPHAEEALAALQRLATGREVELLYGGARRDAYGRTLAQLRLTDRRVWVEGVLLREGAARVRTWPDNRALASEMLEAEAAARRRGRGLWSSPGYAVRLPQEVGPQARGFMLVEGRIRAVGADGDRIRLGFVDSPDGFAAEIPRRAAVDFRVAGVDPNGLVGALVRVRGAVRPTAGGARLQLDHPEQIERLTAAKTKTPGARPGVASDERKSGP